MVDATVLAVLASLSIPGGTAWVEPSEVKCLAEIVWHEARNRHDDAQAGVAFAGLDRAAVSGVSVCSSIQRRTYPWANKHYAEIRSRKISRSYAERVAWEKAVTVALFAYVSSPDFELIKRPCQGNPTHFDRWRSRPWALDPWKHKFKIRCWLDGIAFWEER